MLGAKLNSAFQGTFSSAQKILAATQKELQALNKTQSDISAYQRQQAGLEKSQAQLEVYKKQLEIARDALKKLGEQENADVAQVAALESKETELVNKINSASLAISDKNKRLDEMLQKLSDAGVDTNNLSTEANRLEQEMAELAQQEEEAAQEAEKFGDAGAASAEAVASALAAAGIVKLLDKIYDAYSECVGISMEFGSTMSTVEALSGATSLEMKALTAQAKELGATTAFTANQSAQAMTYMGMAGWDASEMMSGMSGVIALAAASGEDLAMVSDIVTDNLTAFGLTAKDTAHFSDVLAQAASKSNTSVAIMGETFKGSASVAGALGYSIEDVAVMTGLMANAGVKGSIANTVLKNTFNGLLNGATLTSKAFGEVEYTSLKADGTMKTLKETVDELRGYFEQMTDAERVSNAMAIAGQRGYNGLLAILNATEEDYASLTASINSCSGAAQRMADIKLDNLKGDVTLLDSAAEGLKNTIGGMHDDELRKLAQIGTEILTGINNFCKKNPAVVKAIMAIVGAVGAMVVINTATNAVKKFGGALKGLLAMNPHMIALTAGIAALAGTAAFLRTAFKQTALEEQTLNTATRDQIESADRLNLEYEYACEVYGETSDRARALKYDLDEATAAINSQSFSVSELYSEIDALHDSTSEMISTFSASTSQIADEREGAQVLAAKLKDIANSSDEAAVKQAKIEPIVERLNQLYPTLGLTVENVSDKLGGLSEAIDKAAGTDSLQAKLKAANEQYAVLTEQEKTLSTAYEKAATAQSKARERYLKEAGNGQINNPLDFFDKFGKTVAGTVTGNLKTFENELDEANEKASTAYADLMRVRNGIAECEAIFAEYGMIVNGTSDKVVDATTAVSIAINNVTNETQNLLQAYNDAYQAAYESVSGQYNLWTKAEKAIPISIDTINSSLASQESYWDSYSSNLEKLLGKTDEVDGLRDILASFADGSAESVNAIAGMANASDEQLKKMVENYSKAKAEEEKVAAMLAEVKVDIESKLGEINDTLEASVEIMTKDKEAKAAAKKTIEAYINEISASAGKAGAAADQVAAAVTAALSGLPTDTNGTDITGDTYFENGSSSYDSTSDYEGVDRSDGTHFSGGGGGRHRGYAVGTDYAAAGLALVGEEGPELVRMRGGEQVYTAQETKAILGGGFGGSITVSPTFVLNGDIGNDTESRLREYADQLVEMVKDALDEAGINKQRSVYA